MTKDTILVIDDDELSVELIKLMFAKESSYKVDSVGNGKEALAYLTNNYKRVALILLDLVMPEVDGNVLLKVLYKKGITKIIPVIVVTGENDNRKIVECYKYGASDIVLKPFIAVVVKGRIRNALKLYQNKQELTETINKQTSQIQQQNKTLQKYNDKLIEVMSSIVEFRNLESSDHIQRIKKMTKIVATMLCKLYPEKYKLTPEKVEIIESASALHDIGMIAISDSILLKPGKLSDDEYEVIKSHTTLGCEVLTQIEGLQDKEYLKVCYNICRNHHERYDGKGYPDQISGEDIPIEAQIVGLVDAYDGLVTDKIYRDAFDKNKAYEMIMNGKCGAFSKELLAVFSKCRSLIEKVDEYVEGV